MDEDFQTTGEVTHRFLRRFGIAGLAAILSLGLADRVSATYLRLDCTPAYAECNKASQTLDYDRLYSYSSAGYYIDRGWYYLLDYGQYYYLDRGQYYLLGGLSYQLGHPCYPKLFERDWVPAVGFTNRVNICWFRSCDLTPNYVPTLIRELSTKMKKDPQTSEVYYRKTWFDKRFKNYRPRRKS